MIDDYFSQLKEYVEKNYVVTEFNENRIVRKIGGILGFSANAEVKKLYETYEEFTLSWYDRQNKYVGYLSFVGYDRLLDEHENIVEIMNECYEAESDDLEIADDINHWYPVILFGNGDAFCLDTRNGMIVFYEHDVFEGEKNLHGLTIAASLNDLFEKWSKIHFADYYYWDEIVNDEGIDLSNQALFRLMK